MAYCVGQNASEPQVAGSNHGKGYINFKLFTWNYKNLTIVEKKLDFRSKIFSRYALEKSAESGSNPSMRHVF